MNNETEQLLEAQVTDALAAEKELAQMESELSQNEQFRAFLVKQKEVRANIDTFWKNVEEQMIAHDIKNIKGDWGSITIAERIGWNITEGELPPRFYKKVPDTKKITDTFRLEGKAPKGTEPTYTKYLTRRIK